MKAQHFAALHPKVILGIAAHPDDLDYGAAGTMARFASEGAVVHYLIITDGSKGTADVTLDPARLVRLRQAEQRAALEAIGGKDVEFLSYPDGGLEVTMDLKRDIVKAIRAIKPDIVIAIDPAMLYSARRGLINHPDHRAVGQATLDAVFPLARDHLAFPELYAAGYKCHVTPTVLLVDFDEGNFAVDITDTFDRKIAALAAHASQVPDIQATEELMKELAAEMGKTAGCALAESFVRIDIQ